MPTTVRFHLARGEHYRHWQVKRGAEVHYYDPSQYILVLWGCRLQNHAKVAQKIHEGGNKKPCAWVECEMIGAHLDYPQGIEAQGKITYNPRVTPHWIRDDKLCDKAEFRQMITSGSQLFWVQKHV